MNWETTAQEKFRQMLDKIPAVLRPIAEKKVGQRAEALAVKDNRGEVLEKDMVDAFFVETPFGFHGPMKTDMAQLGIDYVQYGYEK